ncbi:MAG TPA: UbiA family prenyltransferase [Gemmatimonadales bacterium]|nr:UbiA family prenyltransferase [Gemmatimonadales bacterium]
MSRKLGYRLLGRGFDYLLHLRPAEWPILTGHLLTGAALSVGLRGLFHRALAGTLFAGGLCVVIGLNGGTLALNSAFDRDVGDIAYLRRPPPPPPQLGVLGFGLMLLGLAASLLLRLPRAFLLVYSLCLVLSVLYSVPPFRLKAKAGLDWIINLLGFGLLTPYAGWVLTGRALTPVGWTLLIAFALLFSALYPLTQLYQLEEDRRRGDRTLAAVLGVERSLGLAVGMAVLAFAGFALAGWEANWAGAGAWLRWGAVAVAAIAWASVLLPWWRQRRSMAPTAHQAGMQRALGVWALTDLAVLFAWAR